MLTYSMTDSEQKLVSKKEEALPMVCVRGLHHQPTTLTLHR